MPSMEKASAACALEWSKELEKGLRSRKPGQCLESIQLIGARIKKWGGEPKLKMATCNLFRLVPGEDQLFADSVLLRLADTYVSGDIDIRMCVIKVFLFELQHGGRKRRLGHGMLSKMSPNNRLELMRRVGVTLDDADLKSRALTLALFGCWAEYAKDMFDIRFAVLSSLASSNLLEVKASLFAAGRFSEYSDDFAFAFLEMLIDMITSAESFPMLKVAAAQLFAKMGYSPLLASKAYKAGSRIVLSSLKEDFLPTLLISLSKLASKSMTLSSMQVSLLCSLLHQNITPNVQAVVHRSIRFILENMSHGSIRISSFLNFFRIFDDPLASSFLRCEGLRVFVQIMSSELHETLLSNIHKFDSLLTFVIKATSSEHIHERVLAFQALVGLSIKVKGWKKKTSDTVGYLPRLPEVVSCIGKEISMLLKPVPEEFRDSQTEQHLKSFLKLFFIIIEGCPDLSSMVLDNICSLIQNLINMHGVNGGTAERCSDIEKAYQSFLFSKLLVCMYKFLVAYLERLDATNDATAAVLCKVKHLVCIVCQSSSLSCSLQVFYMLQLPCVNLGCLQFERKDKGKASKLVLNEIHAGKCLKTMFAEQSNWFAYLAGVSAACEGVWIVAHSIFQQLSTRVHSSIFCIWLRSLSQFAYSEKCLQVIYLPEYSSLNSDETTARLHNDNSDTLSAGSTEMLIGTCDGLRSAERMLRTLIKPEPIFSFQAWFLAMRLKVLETVVDVVKLLSVAPPSKDVVGIPMIDVSFKLWRMAQVYDLMMTSCLNMDSKSQRIISSLALGCSVLAFCTGFAYFFPNLHFHENLISCSLRKHSGSCLHHHVTLVQDLVGRLQDVDPTTCMALISLLNTNAMPEVSSQSYSQFYGPTIGAGHLLRVCQEAVKGIVDLKNDSVDMRDENTKVANNREQLLSDVIREWFCVPFQTPKFFFQPRPSAGAALFSCSSNRDKPDELSINQGSQLSLDLCLQLMNVPPDLHSQLTKIFCILYCKQTFLTRRRARRESDECVTVDHQAWTTDTIILLQKKLQWYARKSIGESMSSIDVLESDKDDDLSAVETCVSFETNGSVQVFSSCVLDISSFPPQSYQLHWHSCCIDSNGSFWSLLPMNEGPVFTVI